MRRVGFSGMRSQRLRLATLAVAAAAAVAGTAGPSSASPASGEKARTYIVVLRGGVSSQAVAVEHARTFRGQIRHLYRFALNGYAARLPRSAAAALRSDPRVLSVHLDRPVRIDAQTLPTGIDRIDGDLSSTGSGNGSGSVDVDIAVIDTGIDTKHPDLSVAGGINCSSGKPGAFNDGNGHGSHVAGTAAARDNEVGVVGVAPGARLWAVRVLNNAGFGSFADIICGVDWVTERAGTIEVANMSLGGSGSDSACGSGRDALHEAICNSVSAGVTYAVAAGNESDDAENHVPAAYDEVITVSALADFEGKPGGLAAATCRSDQDDTFADFSNFGSDVDLIAPGVCIHSTYKKGGYATLSGTSMASPHVAGAAALYKSTHPTATPAQVKAALQSAGNLNWSTGTDPDGSPDTLVNVDTF